MSNVSTLSSVSGLNGTNHTAEDGSIACGPPPGWSGMPPPGVYVDIATMLQNILLPIIIMFGSFGNTLTVTVLFRQSRKLSSTDLFLLCLAISDTVLLCNAPMRRWIISAWDFDVRHYGKVGCKISVYLTYCSIQFSSWILVAVSIERLISVVWPHRVKLSCTKKNSGLFTIVIFVIIFGLNTHILYGFGRSMLPVHAGEGFCEPQYEGYLYFWKKIYSLIDFAVSFAMPFIVIIVANAIIIHKLSQARRERKEITSTAKTSSSSDARDSRSINIMLVSLGVLFFLCMAPVSVYFIYAPYWETQNKTWICIDVYEYIRLSEIRKLIFAIVTILAYSNASLNFLLYVLSGSKFRTQIKALFLCRPVRSESVFGSGNTSSHRQRHTAYSEMSSMEHVGGIMKKSTMISAGDSLDQSKAGDNAAESKPEEQVGKY